MKEFKEIEVDNKGVTNVFKESTESTLLQNINYLVNLNELSINNVLPK